MNKPPATSASPITLPDWPRAHAGPPISGRLKAAPEDFRVEECLGFELDDEGPFLWLQIEKTNANTQWLARQLAEFANVPPDVVGFAGLKDRHAITSQWFSLPWGQKVDLDWGRLNSDELRVLQLGRHGRKLRRGDHVANRFQLRLRQVAGDLAGGDATLSAIQQQGFPNYFGEQRFGIGNANLTAALAWFAGGSAPRRAERGFYLSAARAWLFNQVLARRVEQANWCLPLAGDLMESSLTGHCFPVSNPDEKMFERCRSLELSPTGPLYGSGEPKPGKAAGALEAAVLAGQSDWVRGLQQQRMRPERRLLRALASSLQWAMEEDNLLLSFELGTGSYATALLRELVRY